MDSMHGEDFHDEPPPVGLHVITLLLAASVPHPIRVALWTCGLLTAGPSEPGQVGICAHPPRLKLSLGALSIIFT